MALADLLAPVLQSDPNRLAIIGNGQRLSYRDLEERACRLAHYWLAAGLEPFERVALWLPNGPELLIAYLGCWKAGLIAVPLDRFYTASQVRFILQDSGTRAVIVHASRSNELQATGYLDELVVVLSVGQQTTLTWAVPFAELPSVPPGDFSQRRSLRDRLSTIFYTSGTTRRPKGVVHSELHILRRVEKLIDACRIGRDTVSLVCLSLLRPLAFQVQALAVLRAGGTVVTLDRFSADAFWKSYAEPPAKTLLAFTPDMLAAVLDHPAAGTADFTSLRVCLAGADRVPLHLHKRFRARTGLELTEMCGMTETGPYAMNPVFGRKKLGSIGLPPPDVALRIIDDAGRDVPAGEAGQILVQTPDVMLGYWNDTLQTFETMRDGWLYTGDRGRIDADGYVWFEGRLKEIIVRDGNNVSPAEVEAALQEHPAVRDAVVVGVDDPPHGQAVEAFVRWRSDAAASSVAALIEEAARRLRFTAVPRHIYVLTDWPRTAQGKVDRQRLQWMAAAGGERV